ncbi:MAG: ABC transporter substrate-binding protein [Propionibacteriaceae bacterium]|nr:ABC transporter substrate-binding protein [Propionibacteriaceae bacterium]
MGHGRQGLRALLVGGALVVGLAACDQPVIPVNDPTVSPTSPASAEPVAGINQRQRSELATGGDFRLGLTTWTEDWNPWTQELSDQLELVLAALRPRLFEIDAGGTLTPNPDWLDGPPEVAWQPDTAVTYHLNPQARWGDGQPVTAADFEATWRDCAAARGDCADRGFDRVRAVTAGAGAHDVVVTYDGVYVDWPFTFIDGPARAGSATVAWTRLADHQEWTAGPYVVAAADASGHSLELIPNRLWWGQPALLDTVTVSQVDPTVAAELFTAGLLDTWPLELDPARHSAAAQLEGVQIRRSEGSRWRLLAVGQAGPLADRRARRGIILGLDRALIGQADLPGIGWRPTTLGNLVWQPGQVSYSDQVAAAGLEHDPQAAAAALDAAGWRLGEDGWRQRDGQPLELVFLVDPDDPLSQSEALQVAAQLRDLGVAVTLTEPQSHEAFAAAWAAGDFDLAGQGWNNQLQPALSLAQGFVTGAAGNVGGYSNAVVDADLESAARNQNSAARARLLAAAAATLAADVAAIPLYVLPETWATDSTLANFGPSGLATLRWQDVGFTR